MLPRTLKRGVAPRATRLRLWMTKTYNNTGMLKLKRPMKAQTATSNPTMTNRRLRSALSPQKWAKFAKIRCPSASSEDHQSAGATCTNRNGLYRLSHQLTQENSNGRPHLVYFRISKPIKEVQPTKVHLPSRKRLDLTQPQIGKTWEE